jgi:hypothetical protein
MAARYGSPASHDLPRPYGAEGAKSPFSVVSISFPGLVSLRWSLPLGRAAACQHRVPSWPGALKVQVGQPPGWFCNTAEADGKQEASRPLATGNCLPLSDDVCGGFASVGFMFKGSVGCKDSAPSRLSTVMLPALAERA